MKSLVRQIKDVGSGVTEDTAINVGTNMVRNMIKGVDEPQRNYMWHIVIRDTLEAADKHKSDSEDLQFYATSCTIPSSTSEPIEKRYAGIKYYKSGWDSSEKILRVTFWDDKNLKVYRYMNYWYNLTNDPRTNVAVSEKKSKKDMQVVLKDTTDLFVSETIHFLGCSPTEVGDISLTYEESNVVTFDMSFQFQNKYVGEERFEGLTGGSENGGDSFNINPNSDNFTSPTGGGTGVA